MESAASKFPFSTSFQFREDESAGLEALFERTFFDTPFSAEARQALVRTSFGKRREDDLPGDPKGPAAAQAKPSSSAGLESLAPPAAVGAAPGDAARYVLLYRGSSGIGKTRIFRRFREIARRRNIPVYEVYHHEVEGIPFKPFLHAIREILRDHDHGAALQEKYRHGLEAIFPELYDAKGFDGDAVHRRAAAPLAPPFREEAPFPPHLAQGGGSAERVRAFDAVTQLLLEVTARRPLLILVHDLHASDRPTIELLGYIGRNLQLRQLRASQPGPGDTLFPEPGAGPELDDFENEEWRALSRRVPQGLDLIGAQSVPSVGGEELAGAAASAFRAPRGREQPAVPSRGFSQPTTQHFSQTTGPGSSRTTPAVARLMVLANYRGFSDSSNYLEQALRSLGEEPFVYHGELRVLDRDEADRFIQQSIEGVRVGDVPLEVEPEAIDAIYEASEGFPSFMHELFRGLYLQEGGFAARGDPLHIWTGGRIRDVMAAVAGPAGDTTGAGSPLVASGVLLDEGTAVERRHAILRLRLASTTPEELRVLQVIAVAGRPVTPGLIATALDGGPDSPRSFPAGEDGSSFEGERSAARALATLEERGIVERQETGDASLLVSDTSYFFRLWDYALVVADGILPEVARVLHQRVGEELRARLETEGDEGAYEVYYHLRSGLDPASAVPYGLIAANRFLRSFALQRARRVYESLLELLPVPADPAGPEGREALAQRIDVLEKIARIGIALKEGAAAEEILRQAQTEGAPLAPERRAELVLLEAEAARLTDPGRGLKILGKMSKLLADETSRLGARVQLATAVLRMERQDMKRAINFALKGIAICQKVGDIPELGELHRVMAEAFYRKGDYAHAVDNYQRALDALERLGLKDASVWTLDELGRVYLERGNHFRAARYLYKSLEIRRRQQDIAGLCKSYDELGRVYLRSGDYLKTIENLNRSLSLKERTGDFAGLNPTLSILGDLYFRLGRYEQALLYFKREVENSQKLGDTRGLVEAFCHLGRVYFELGDLKQADSLAKQVSILATEFKLRSEEADGNLLAGGLQKLARDWGEAEKNLKAAADVFWKLGHKRREAAAHLELAELKIARELYDEALKHESKGQIIAEELKSVELQVRSLAIKGNIYRHLKGGNIEKVRENLHKALELAQGLNEVGVLFDLYYSLAKVCHSEREYAEASNYYTKAELILKQIGEALSEDRAARFFDDRRRRVFAEDIARFRKDVLGRATVAALDLREPAAPAPGGKDRPIGAADYKDLSARVLRIHAELNQLHFHDRLLIEALELSGADRGFILRVQNRQYFPVAFQGFGKSPAELPEFATASGIAQEAIRKGRSVLASGLEGEKEGKSEARLDVGCLAGRSILTVPFMTDDRIFGGVYLDKPVAVGQFLPRHQVLLETFAEHAAVALHNRREFETAIREPVTGFYTPSFFVDRLREAYRWFNLHGKAFAVIGYYLPSLEDALVDGRDELSGSLARELAELLPHRAVICWGAPILYILLEEEDAPQADEIVDRVRQRLCGIFNEEVIAEALPVHNRYQRGSEIYFEMRRRLLPEASDRKMLGDIRALLAHDVPLREAKKILERHKIETTLRKTGGNITHAARELGIHRPQLSNLLKKHELRREVFESGDLDENEDEDGSSSLGDD
jgi:tetratricopeptide (TPR) repeat protein